MIFLPHLISLIISLCNYAEVVVMASSNDNDNIEMKPKSKMMHQFDHLSASALGLLKEHRGRMIKKNLEEFVKDNKDKVMDHLRSRRLKAKEPRGKSDKDESSASTIHRHRPHSDPTKAAKAKADPTKAAKAKVDPNESEKALISCEAKLAENEVKLQESEEENEGMIELLDFLLEQFEYLWSLPTLLFVQMSDRCTIDNSTGTPILKALKQDFLNVTEAFTDRPYRHEFTNSTADFFSSFNDTFDNGGENGTEWPNSAITFVDDNQSIGVAVSAFVGSYFDASDTYYGECYHDSLLLDCLVVFGLLLVLF